MNKYTDGKQWTRRGPIETGVIFSKNMQRVDSRL